MKKVVHFEVHFVILYSKTELLRFSPPLFLITPTLTDQFHFPMHQHFQFDH